MAQIWEYGRPLMPRRRNKRALAAITSVIAAAALVMGLMPAAFAVVSVDLTVTIDNKVYDGGVTATILGCTADQTNVVSGDSVDCDLTGVTASFGNKNVEAGKTVTLNQNPVLTLGGGNTESYQVGSVNVGMADITVRTLNVTLNAVNKVYDGTTAATGSTLNDDRVGGDSLTLTSTNTFADKDAADGKTVEATGIAISGGTDAGNYTLGNTTDTDTANITKRPVDVSVQIADKTYDGTTTASVTGCTADQTDVISPDVVTCDDSGITAADFADANVGTGKTVTLTTGDPALAGAGAGNYELGTVSVDRADITGPIVAYTGDTYLVSSSTTVILSATVSNAGSCAGTATFLVKDVLGATVYNDVAATIGPLTSGIYTVDVYYGTDPVDANCAASDSAVITIVTAGGSTNGGGWYRRADYSGEGSARANFGLVLNKTYTGTGKTKTVSGYKGDFVWVSGQGWRVKARLSGDANYFGTFTCPGTVGAGSGSACGSFQASGVLEYWDAEALGGMGDWAYEADVTFTVTVYDGGSVTICKRKACTKTDVADWFGININGYSSAELPETTPVKLLQPAGKGSIKVLP